MIYRIYKEERLDEAVKLNDMEAKHLVQHLFEYAEWTGKNKNILTWTSKSNDNRILIATIKELDRTQQNNPIIKKILQTALSNHILTTQEEKILIDAILNKSAS